VTKKRCGAGTPAVGVPSSNFSLLSPSFGSSIISVEVLKPAANFSFKIERVSGAARLGRFETPHGAVETPAFMPVATQGTIKGLSMDEVAAAGGRMVLSNAYHLYLRPGDMMVRALGGLHAFARWDGPMLTDSGGFQVFSLAKLRAVREEGVEFRSHIDGSLHQYTPEGVMRVERNLGADVVMQLDELVAGRAAVADARAAMERSLRWLARCRNEFDRIGREGRAPLGLTVPAHTDGDDVPSLRPADPERERAAPPQALLPIVQGGTDLALRRASIEGMLGIGDWHGIAIGGLSVGEPKAAMYAVLDGCEPLLPDGVPRYLMGVGFPDDLVEGVRRGIDLFDCVAPTRMGRDGTAFTPDGKVQIRKGSHRTDPRPLVEGCGCPCCTRYDRAYLRHLFASEEMLGLRLLALHNLTFLLDVMRDARDALRAGAFTSWSEQWLDRYRRAAAAPA
jgi:queuine tRNA-ribosyltransferase